MDKDKKFRLPYFVNREFFFMLLSAGAVALSIVAIILEKG